MTTKTEIFWDDKDPNNAGWAFRLLQTDSNGGLIHEDSGAIDGSAADALDCINDGYAPDEHDLGILRRDFYDATFSDKNGSEIGDLFPS